MNTTNNAVVAPRPVRTAEEKAADQAHAMEVLVKMGNKSKTIKYLTAEGWERGRIAQAMGIKYQFVRNVLVKPAKKEQAPATTK